MEAKQLDHRFDKGEDISEYLDLSRTKKLNLEQKRVNVDFPRWMIESLDQEAKRIGVPRPALIKLWIAERLERNSGEGADN
ncbi:MAG: CopG family antitoxin [Chloroflexota bacterium]|nr:CopG family antitoxin [Chloroflexota bacterium]